MPQNVVGNINHPHEGNVGFDIDDNTQISDLAIFGMTTNRANRGHGINGRLGKNTKISNVWIEHVNVGAWVGRDYSDTPAYWNPGDGLEFSGMRIRDTYADGINFSNGTRNSRVFNSSFRTTGDDSLAVWANPRVKDPSVDVASNNHFVNNTYCDLGSGGFIDQSQSNIDAWEDLLYGNRNISCVSASSSPTISFTKTPAFSPTHTPTHSLVAPTKSKSKSKTAAMSSSHSKSLGLKSKSRTVSNSRTRSHSISHSISISHSTSISHSISISHSTSISHSKSVL